MWCPEPPDSASKKIIIRGSLSLMNHEPKVFLNNVTHPRVFHYSSERWTNRFPESLYVPVTILNIQWERESRQVAWHIISHCSHRLSTRVLHCESVTFGPYPRCHLYQKTRLCPTSAGRGEWETGQKRKASDIQTQASTQSVTCLSPEAPLCGDGERALPLHTVNV